ncbi:MAG: cupin [Acidimicrobiaceae bacterium]|nr:cupin [Acidimicrobiaceae bacterium]
MKPIAKTGSCEAAHTGYFISGRMKVVMDDGEEMEYGPGDFAVMAGSRRMGYRRRAVRSHRLAGLRRIRQGLITSTLAAKLERRRIG